MNGFLRQGVKRKVCSHKVTSDPMASASTIDVSIMVFK